MIRDDQPDAREGQAGRAGVAERLVVPLKPGNAGGGKEPQFKTDATRSEGPEIGKPINSEKCSEAADGVTRESEGRSRVMPVEERSLSSRPTQDVVRDLEIGQPSNSEKCSETADGVTRES